MLIDPLGRIMKQCGTKEEVIFQEIGKVDNFTMKILNIWLIIFFNIFFYVIQIIPETYIIRLKGS